MKLLLKNKLFPMVLLLLIASSFLIPLFSNEFYLSHDGEAHVARFAAYYKAFLDGQFPLRWAGDLNYGYGSPIFIFYYPLPGIISILLRLIGLSFELIFKTIIGLFFVLNSITFFLWAREFVKKEVAFLGALLYGFAPYHFLNLYVRGDVAELTALAIAPLVFWSIKKIVETKLSKFIILGSIFYSLLILSHNATGLIFSPVIFIYAFVLSEKPKDLILGLTPIVLGLILSAFFWIPVLAESRYTNSKLFIGDMYKNHFPSFQKLIYSSWNFGPDVNKPKGLSPQIGIVNLALAIGSISLVFQKLRERKNIIFWVIVFLTTLFLTMSFSSFIWQNVSLLSFLQFPWRITSLSSFASIILTTYFLNKIIDKKIIIILTITIVLYSLSFLKIQPINRKADSFYLSYKGTTDYHGAASSIWTAGDFSSLPKSPYEIIEGKGKIISKERNSVIHSFNVKADIDIKIVDNTVYFPGWQTTVDGKKTPIEFQDPNYRGLITFDVPRGTHNVKVSFRESPIRLFSDYLSLFGLFIIVMFFILRSRIDKTIKKL